MKLKTDWLARLRRNKGWILRALLVSAILAPLLLIELLLNLAADITDWMKWKWEFSPTLERINNGLSRWVGRPKETEVPDGRG